MLPAPVTPIPAFTSALPAALPAAPRPSIREAARALHAGSACAVLLAGLLVASWAAANPVPTGNSLQVLSSDLVAGAGCAAGEALCLEMTVGLADLDDPNHCPTGKSVVANVGDVLAWCFTVSNNGDQPLAWHTLRDSVHGDILVQVQQTLAAGESLRYVRRRTANTMVSESVQATWTASAGQPGYSIDDNASFDYVDVSNGVELQWTGGFASTRSAPLQLPFAFDFFGVPADQLCVGKNGGIEVGLLGCTLPAIFGVPTIYAGLAIAVAWSPFDDNAGSARALIVGDTPGARKAVIEWRDMVLASSPAQPGFTFQVVIDEASGELLFQYQQMGEGQGGSGDAGGESVAGLQSAWYLAGLQYSGNGSANLDAGTAVRWTPVVADGLVSAADNVDLDIGAARLLLPIPQINAETPAGTTTYRSLPLVNTGNRRLDWQVGEYPAHAGSVAPVATSGGTSPLPAFAVERGQEGAVWNLVGLDLLAPGTATTVLADLPAQQLDFSDSTFVDHDHRRLWVMNWPSRTIHSIDLQSGNARTVGVARPRPAFNQEGWYGLAWDPTTDTLYGSTATSACGWSGLYRIDQDTAEARFVGPIVTGANVCISALAFTPDGQLYGVDLSSRALVAIDKVDATGQLIGALGYNPDGPQGLAADPVSGELYLTATPLNEGGRIGRMDVVSGVPEWLDPPAQGHSLSAISIVAAGGECSEPLDAAWLQLDTLQGALEPNSAAYTIVVDFDATTLEPGEYAADVCIFNNDPDYRNQPEIVPVRLVVQPALELELFADGFE